MAAGLFNRYMWLVDTIYSAGRITLKEINRRWARSAYNDMRETEIPERTFHRHKEAIKSMFDIEIKCDKSDGNRYYIERADDLNMDVLRKWLIDTFSVNAALRESRTLNNRILLEEIPSAQRFLTRIIEAMRNGLIIEIAYQSFRQKAVSMDFAVEPYCIKLFRQRWYLIGRSIGKDEIRIYAFDRFDKVAVTEKTFEMPEDFDAQLFFDDCYGIVASDGIRPEQVAIKVKRFKRDYLLSLPLHHSQKEVERTGDYSVFEYFIRPTFDFKQELHSHGAAIEILSPEWLREEFAEEAVELNQLYSART